MLQPIHLSRKRLLILAAWIWAFAIAVPGLDGTSGAVGAQDFRPQKASLELAEDRTAYEAGGEARLAAVVTIDEGWHVNSHQPTFEWLIPTDLSFELPEGWEAVEIEYPSGQLKTFAFEDQPLSVYEGGVRLLSRLSIPETAAGAVAVKASLSYQACDDETCLPPVTTEATVNLTIGGAGSPVHAELFAPTGSPTASPEGRTGEALPSLPSLAGILLLGIIGGLILNAMPCVLPVLSLKVFALVQSAGQGRSHVVLGALATASGILASFWALAGAAILARSAGNVVGWGTQFQHPGFVTFLAAVVVLFSLNLWGLFEIPLPQGLARAASSGSGQGLAGHFASGLFATLMATPCSAPFLGTAVGFALAQPAASTLAVFTAVGVGMALPYLVLAAVPEAARWLPKPGAWMDSVRKVMGFLLAGAAVWLFYVLGGQVSPERLAVIELGLLLLALVVWVKSRTRPGAWPSRLAVGATLLTLAGTLAIGFLAPRASESAGIPESSGLIDWVVFDRALAEETAAQGRPVFVDVTAKWCFTCKMNERFVLQTPEVADAFERGSVVAMKADWTNRNEEIGRYLATFGKAGIPFYVLYRPGQEPYVFSELLTKQAVISTVDELASNSLARVEK